MEPYSILALILALAIVGGIGYYIYSQIKKAKALAANPPVYTSSGGGGRNNGDTGPIREK